MSTFLLYCLEDSENIFHCMRVGDSHDLNEIILYSFDLQKKDKVVLLSFQPIFIVFEHFLVEIWLNVLLQLCYLDIIYQTEKLTYHRKVFRYINFYLFVEIFQKQAHMRNGVNCRKVSLQRFDIFIFRHKDEFRSNDLKALELLYFWRNGII